MTITKFVFEENGKEVYKVECPSGATGYIAADVPREALIGIRDKLLAELRGQDPDGLPGAAAGGPEAPAP